MRAFAFFFLPASLWLGFAGSICALEPSLSGFSLTAESLRIFGYEDTPTGLVRESDGHIYVREDRIAVLRGLSEKLKGFHDPRSDPRGLTAPRASPALGHADHPGESPISEMEAIYRADNPEALLEIFKKQYRTIVYSPELYKSVFSNVVSRNDSVDMQELGHKRDLSEEDRIRLAIRMLARCILRMGDIDRDGERLLEMAQMLFTLPEPAQGWHNQYFYTPLYNALAKNCPKKLKAMSRRPPPQFQVDSGEAALALLRNGHPVGQEVIRSILRRNPRENGYMPLLYYLRDSGFKLGYLGKKWEEDKDSIYSRREIINALASFPEGETRLLEMKEEGAIRWEKSSGICFGTLSRSVTEDDLKSEGAMQAMSQAGGYIMKANQRFGGAERILYVDITSDEDAEGHALNIAGWGQNSLYMTRSAFLGRSARCVAFMLAHEACEQRSVQGYLTAELGLSYLKAVSNPRRNDGALEDLRLGARVGGNYVDTGLGHPWDSEREWLAESASAVIIGEPVPQRARDAIASAIATFRNP